MESMFFMREKLNLKDKAKVTVAALGLGAFALGGCSEFRSTDELIACPRGWRTDLEVDAGRAVGVLGAISQKAMSGEFGDKPAVEDAFKDGLRLKGDQLDEVACEVDGKVVLSSGGAKLVTTAAMADVNLGASQPLGDQLMNEQPQ